MIKPDIMKQIRLAMHWAIEVCEYDEYTKDQIRIMKT